jgi:hypothetical protein
MEIKEYIKSLIRELLDEESGSGAVGGYLTPKAFAKNGQGPNAATKQSKRLGWELAEDASRFTPNIGGSTKTKGPGKRFIPRGFEIPSEFFDPIDIGGEKKIHFKVITKGDESILLISHLTRLALEAIERGRTSFEKEQRLPILTRMLKEKMPGGVRGILKKYTTGVNLLPNGFIPVPVKITHDNLTQFESTPNLAKDSNVRITEKGINLLKAIKENPAKYKEIIPADYLQFLVFLYKGRDSSTTPATFASISGVSKSASSKIATSMSEKGLADMDVPSQSSQEDSTDKWYIYNPGSPGVDKDAVLIKGVGTNLYENIQTMIKKGLLNEVTYNKFKNEVKFRTKNEQLHKAIREVKRKLSEIDRIVEYTSRMKQELSEGEEGMNYWKKTQNNLSTISEMVDILNNKIKNLNQ